MSLTVGQMFAGVLAYDSLIYKAAGETYLTRRVETRLFKALSTVFIRRAKEGVDKAVGHFEATPGVIDERETQPILDTLAHAFAGWDKEVAPLVRVATAEIYRAGKEGVYSRKQKQVVKAVGGPAKGSKVLEVKPKFDLVDKDAVETLSNQQLYWIAGTYDNALSEKIAKVANSVMIEQGLTREAAAKVLESALAKEFGYDVAAPFSTWSKPPLPMGWKGSGISYIEGLTSNAATTARVHGAVKGFTELGVTHYQVMVAGDERTCSRCNSIGERTFTVESAQKITISVLAADTPEGVKEAHPWGTDKQISSMTDGKSKTDAATNAKLAKAGMSIPPFHYKCRCFIDIAEDTEFIPDAVEDDVPEVPPVPTPATPVELAPGPDDFPWKAQQLIPVNKSLSGMHTKLVFRDPDGNEWIFKPQDGFRALGDKAAADLATLFGRDTADVYLYTHKGQIGSIQKVFSGVIGDLGGVVPEALTAGNVAELQKEHLFDWLISQHDTHRENVLQVGNGLKFIDKGQTFRFFGLDKLNYAYGGAGHPNPVETYYHRMFSDYASGRAVKLSKLADLEDFLKKIESVSDEAIANAIRPYAREAMKAAASNPGMKSATWMGRFKNEDEFIASVLARKNSLRGDVEKFYKDLEKERNKHVKGDKPAKAPKVAAGRSAVFKLALEDSRRSGWIGKSIMVRGPDYEDMSFLMYGTEGDGTFLESKLRPIADKKLRALVGLKQEAAAWDAVAAVDPLYNDVLTVTKSFNHHLAPGGSGTVPEKTKTLADRVMAQLGMEANKEKASFYAAHMSAIYDKENGWKKDGVGKLLEKFKDKEAEAKLDSLPKGWKATLVRDGDPISRKMVNGKIVYDKGGNTRTYLDEISPKTYKIETPDGNLEVYYRPHEGSAVTGQGQFKVWMKKPISELTEKEVEAALSSLSKLGLETELASKTDLELMYLRKMSFKHKWDSVTDKISDTLPVDEQISKLKAYMTEQGVKFGKGYKPEPIYDRADGTGWPRWMSHHIKDSQTDKYVLTHEARGSLSDALDNILSTKTNALVPTYERLRVGIPIKGGMSPEEDMSTGGASYVFTRLKSKAAMDKSYQSAFVFRGELLKDMTAVSHNADRYGRFSSRDSRVTTSEWGTTSHKGNNETIFKHDLSLDYLDRINVSGIDERKRVLDVFKKHGITEMAGKKVEDLVVIGGQRKGD
jgi:hypothetical protein